MPLCESRDCNAPVLHLTKRVPVGGRRRYVIVDFIPEKRWVEIEGKAVVVDTYREHPKCAEKEMGS